MTSSIFLDMFTPYSTDSSKINVISGVFRRFTFFASCIRIKPSALRSPAIVFFLASSFPRTLIHALHVLRSGATSTSITDVIGAILGSFISVRISSDMTLRTSSFILLFFTLFLRIYCLLLTETAKPYIRLIRESIHWHTPCIIHHYNIAALDHSLTHTRLQQITFSELQP